MKAKRTEGHKRVFCIVLCWLLVLSSIVLLTPACGPCDDSTEPEERILDNGDGTVSDRETGLMWMKNANYGQMTWDDAIAWAENLHIGGYDDWRLPSGLNISDGLLCNSQPAGANCSDTEFGTLYFDCGVSYISNSVFQDIAAGSYWTSTEFPDDPAKAMCQDMIDGGQNPWSKGAQLCVWAVRDAQPTDQPALINNDDGVVIDTVQCLMWTRDANLPCTLGVSSFYGCWFESLLAAEEWADDLEFAGYDDWRLSRWLYPKQSELEFLFYEILGNPPGGPITITGPFDNVLQSTDLIISDESGLHTRQVVHDDYWVSGGPILGGEATFNINDQSYEDWFMLDGMRFSAWAVREGCDITPSQ